MNETTSQDSFLGPGQGDKVKNKAYAQRRQMQSQLDERMSELKG